MTHYKRLPLETLSNARDLGGFPADGGVTRYGVFVRSEVPKALSENDIRFLLDYGVTLTVDLRGVNESNDLPSLLKDAPGVRYVLNPMYDTEAAKASDDPNNKSEPPKDVPKPEPVKPGEHSFFDIDWVPVYMDIIERGKSWVKRNFEYAAECEGCMHYHCFTGKDRTGILSALLLGVCGVATIDIISDYSLSMSCLRPFYDELPGGPYFVDNEGRPDYARGFYRTAPETMERMVEKIEEKYGTIIDYVLTCDVSHETIDKIRAKFIEKL